MPESPKDTQKTFHFEFAGDHDLTVSEIWPDGDAPENPTTEDVIARVKDSCWSVRHLITDWNLGCSVYIDGRNSELSDW